LQRAGSLYCEGRDLWTAIDSADRRERSLIQPCANPERNAT
jgi:hypothetical protein